jgi:mono/diheme cytochrome c family protein
MSLCKGRARDRKFWMWVTMKEVSKGFRKEARFLLGLAVACFVLVGVAVTAQTNSGTTDESKRLIDSVKGPDVFRAHCAACHGLEGKGDGPAGLALKKKVPDLTVLAKNNKGQFPSVRVRRTIAGEEVSAWAISHGSREMPIWGPIFHQIESDMDWGNVRLDNLTNYLESIQQK